MLDLNAALHECPGIAILRGVEPQDVLEVAEVIIEAGFRVVEVPLNSPSPLESISLLADRFSSRALVGAGTVLAPESVDDVVAAGGQIILSPNMRMDVIERTVQKGLFSVPGVATPTEAFAAIGAGAHMLKLFPCEMIRPAAVKAMRAVLPKEVLLLAVGGVSSANLSDYLMAGADAAGFGSSLYHTSFDLKTICQKSKELRKAM